MAAVRPSPMKTNSARREGRRDGRLRTVFLRRSLYVEETVSCVKLRISIDFCENVPRFMRLLAPTSIATTTLSRLLGLNHTNGSLRSAVTTASWKLPNHSRVPWGLQSFARNSCG